MNLKEQIDVRRIRNGDIQTFEQLFHRYYPGMCSYAESLTMKEDIAEEVVQDVFYNIWKNRDKLRITTSWQSYLFRSVFNNSMMFLRKMKRETRLEPGHIVDKESGSADPLTALELQEVNNLVNETLESLPKRTREIYHLNRVEGLKYAEIAEKLSISIKTVEANMGKALRALRMNFEKYGQ